NVNCGPKPLPISHEASLRRRRKRSAGFTNRLGVDFPQLPDGWNYRSISSLLEAGDFLDYADGNHGRDYSRKSEFGEKGVVFITAAQIRDGTIAFDECPKLNSVKAKSLRKGWARAGDVLLTHNATVGRTALVQDDVEPFLLGTSVTYYRTEPTRLFNRYLHWVFSAPIYQQQLAAVMGQTTRNQVPITRQADLEIPVAPITEQHEIVHRIEHALTKIACLAQGATS